jgi:hypothetical protein
VGIDDVSKGIDGGVDGPGNFWVVGRVVSILEADVAEDGDGLRVELVANLKSGDLTKLKVARSLKLGKVFSKTVVDILKGDLGMRECHFD